MWKRGVAIFLAGIFLVSLYGCLALFAAGAGGAGTAVWLSNKLVQEVDASFTRSLKATEAALNSLRLPIKKKTVGQKVAQIISEYTDGKTIWVDIRPVSERRSKIEIRVGSVQPDEKAAEKILTQIKRYL
jgi:hypothetical protein